MGGWIWFAHMIREEKRTQTSVHTGLCLHTSSGGGRGADHDHRCLCTQDCDCTHPCEAVKGVSLGVCAHKIVFAHTQGKGKGKELAW